MIAMAALQLVHLVDGDFASGVEDGEKSTGRCSLGVVDLGQPTCVTGFVLEDSDQFKSSTVTTSALGRWSLGAHARRISGCHQQRLADSNTGAAIAARRRLALAAVVVIRWSKNLDVIFIMFGVFCTSCELL